jgi:hypothetical protein
VLKCGKNADISILKQEAYMVIIGLLRKREDTVN